MATTKITTPELFDFSATNTALQLPTGDTASRPSAPSAGEWRFNSELKYVEYWDGGSPGAWRQIDTEELPTPDDFPSQNFNVNTYFGNGGTQTIDSKFNEAANFGVSGSVINLSPGLDTFISSNAIISVSLWVKINTQPDVNGQVIFSLGDSRGIVAPGTQSFSPFRFGAQYANSNASQKMADAAFTLNTWTHVVGVLSTNSSDVKLYVDKVLQTTGGATDYLGLQDDACIGNRDNTGYTTPFKGAIDQVRIYPGTLTQTQIDDLYAETTTTASTLNYPSGAGCIAAYQLDGDASDVGGTYGGVETNIGYTGLLFQPDLVWTKSRNSINRHQLFDSVRGATFAIESDTAFAQSEETTALTSFDSNGFSLGSSSNVNSSSTDYVAWCFKAGGAPDATNSNGAGVPPTLGSVMIDGVKSTAALAGATPATNISANTGSGFSIVKYTGPASNSTIAHGLGVTPSMMIQKPTGVGSWNVYIAPGIIDATSNYYYLVLNSTGAKGTTSSAVPTTTTFNAAASGAIIAYCFADIAGYQKIGSYTGENSTNGPIVYTTDDGTATGTGGFEPAFLLIKRADDASSWTILDNKRSTGNPRNKALFAEAADAESTYGGVDFLTNGFQITATQNNVNGGTYIYLAIAADKDSSVPTQANSFSPTIYTGNGGAQNIYTPFAPDFTWIKNRNDANGHAWFDSVRGAGRIISSNSTVASSGNPGDLLGSFNPNGFQVNRNYLTNTAYDTTNGSSSLTYVSWNWKAGGLPTINNDGSITSIVSANQAAGFSIVKYKGIGSTASVGHGLGVVPKLIIAKCLDITSSWVVYSETTGINKFIELNDLVAAYTASGYWGSSAPTNSVFEVNNGNSNNNSTGNSIIAYCFADIAGYQKAGSYEGTGGALTVYTTDDGTSTGANGFQPSFVMIKRYTGGTGNWVIVDEARASGDSRLYANSVSGEDTGQGESFISNGFKPRQSSTTDTNINGSFYIYLAIK